MPARALRGVPSSRDADAALGPEGREGQSRRLAGSITPALDRSSGRARDLLGLGVNVRFRAPAAAVRSSPAACNASPASTPVRAGIQPRDTTCRRGATRSCLRVLSRIPTC